MACSAQENHGIQFEKGINWNAVKEKAKIANKHIFVDIYTTWCGPCKYMSNKIFTEEEVGDYFNINFINVKVQMDKSKNDNQEIKNWYQDAQAIKDTYKIGSYPTYLFLNPDGGLVHIIAGASRTPTEFLKKAKIALDPENQFIEMKKKFQEGKTDSLFIRQLIEAAKTSGEDSLYRLFSQKYLQNKVSLLDPHSIFMIAESITSSKEVGFDIFINNPDLVDSIIGEQKRFHILSYLAYNEEIFPKIMPNGKIKTYPGGMTIYGGGDVSQTVDWVRLEDNIRLKYGNLSQKITLFGKLKHSIWKKDWESFNQLLLHYRLNESKKDLSLISDMASDMLRECNDKIAFKEAIAWSSILAETKNNTDYLLIFGKILYKSGEIKAAITHLESKLVLLNNSEEEYFKKEIEKMKSRKSLD